MYLNFYYTPPPKGSLHQVPVVPEKQQEQSISLQSIKYFGEIVMGAGKGQNIVDMVPLSLLSCNFIVVTRVRLPNVVGIDPVNRFLCKLM
jgi:hypothetical protein